MEDKYYNIYDKKENKIVAYFDCKKMAEDYLIEHSDNENLVIQ